MARSDPAPSAPRRDRLFDTVARCAPAARLTHPQYLTPRGQAESAQGESARVTAETSPCRRLRSRRWDQLEASRDYRWQQIGRASCRERVESWAVGRRGTDKV